MTLYPHHWNIFNKIKDVLTVLKDTVYTLSSVYNPTAHLFLIECLNIVRVLHHNENVEDLKLPIKAMKDRWLDYYKSISLITLVACVFDPRCKLDGLHEHLTTYYEYLDLQFDVNENPLQKLENM